MHHLAILNKSWKLLDKILSGQKTIESRRYKTRRDPWNNIQAGDIVFFKDSGGLVLIKAEVAQILQYNHPTDQQKQEIVDQYGGDGKICFGDIPQDIMAWIKDKNYCVLVFLQNPQMIKPFEIDKTGYGISSAWICVENIEKIKKNY